MNKKLIVAFAVTAAAFGAFAGPRGCPGGWGPRPCGPGWGHCPPPRPYHCHGGDWWGRGGRNFWPGFLGGVVGGLAASTVVSAPVVATPVVAAPVVTTPVVVPQTVVVQQPVVAVPAAPTQNVWVEGQYVDQVQANGSVVRTWSPGHYETRTVTVR